MPEPTNRIAWNSVNAIESLCILWVPSLTPKPTHRMSWNSLNPTYRISRRPLDPARAAACKRHHMQNAKCVHLAFLRRHAKWVDARILHDGNCKPCKMQNALGDDKAYCGKGASKMQNAKCVHPCTALQARKMQNARILHPSRGHAQNAKCKMHQV